MRARTIAASMVYFALAAAGPTAAAKDAYADVHSIGVVSTVGHRLYLNRVGLAGVELETSSLDVSMWRIDEQIERWVAEILAPRFAAKPVALPPEALAACSMVGKCKPVFPADGGVDAYLLVLPEEQKDPYTMQHWFCSGMHAMRHNVWPLSPVHDLFVTYGVAAFDAKTGKRIDYGTSGPWIRMVPGEWTDPATLTEQQWTNLRSTVLRDFAVTLPYTLARANLIERPQDVSNADFNAMIGGVKPLPLVHDETWLGQPFVAPGPPTRGGGNCVGSPV